MTRVRAEVLWIHCADTEDLTKNDDFYLVGVATDGQTVRPMLTPPRNIGKSRHHQPFNEPLLWDAEVSEDGRFSLGLTAFDEDIATDWNKRKEAVTAIS